MAFGSTKRAQPRRAAPVEQREHVVAGRTLPLKIVESDRARRLTLRIDTSGRGLRITIPPGLRKEEVDLFLSRQQGWLEQRLALVPKRPKVRPGIKIPLRGVPHLVVHEPERRGTVSVGSTDGTKVLFVHGERSHVSRRIADFLKRQARRDIEKLVELHCQTVGRRATVVRLRDTSSRWGSCTSDGALSFSWRIVMAPKPVINYLVAHEVAHLREMNHGPRFWKLCAKLCPDTELCKAWLKRNGGALQAIQFE